MSPWSRFKKSISVNGFLLIYIYVLGYPFSVLCEDSRVRHESFRALIYVLL
jgi:hypothetical protein